MPMSHKTVLVTGATAGLGRRLTERLADRGATLLLHGRDEERLAAQCRDLRAKGVEAHPLVADFSALSEVRDLAARLEARRATVDVLINNAGVGPGAEGSERETSRDGHELRFAVGYLAPCLLTRLLLPALRRSPSARVVNVGSAAQADIDLADLEMATSYHGWIAYGRAKLALASFTVDLAEEVKADGITVNCVHPADLMPTALVRETGLAPASTLEQGAEAVLRLACAPEGDTATGLYFNGLTQAAPHDDVMDPDKRHALREATERLLAG
ncbi:SDR family NAD(P)-dependent oxidoreductase [Streptomyces luteogriseus]|uniref:SDR family NAD(P)-dependent oxidoreductase n=1 Tax=Streptomyces luteogriseus TaxID=68233 RepID=UPI00260A39D9|nr:SDR family NAD(P)-dependent oxidoreductase [Streptomyces luteogriseus]WTJ29495.1 SDR family NAD(P)-dependent oxidoreductase [Streptomyces luteogriseus]